MKVVALQDMIYRYERFEDGRFIAGEQTIPGGTIMDVIPMKASAIRAVATPRDDLREIARFVMLEKELGFERAQVPWKRRLAGPNDVLVTWGGQIRFVTIGEEVRIHED